MPQIEQPRNTVTATSIETNKGFQDRLRDRYKPLDNVRVINIDNEPFEWQYFPIDGESEEFTDNGAVRVTTGRAAFSSNYTHKTAGNEQLWRLGPGESEVLLGANADLFIQGLYKRLVAKRRIKEYLNTDLQDGVDTNRDYKTRPEVSFNWNDPLMQEQMIDQIFLGVVKPNFDFTAPTEHLAQEEVTHERPVGRPRKAE